MQDKLGRETVYQAVTLRKYHTRGTCGLRCAAPLTKVNVSKITAGKLVSGSVDLSATGCRAIAWIIQTKLTLMSLRAQRRSSPPVRCVSQRDNAARDPVNR